MTEDVNYIQTENIIIESPMKYKAIEKFSEIIPEIMFAIILHFTLAVIDFATKRNAFETTQETTALAITVAKYLCNVMKIQLFLFIVISCSP